MRHSLVMFDRWRQARRKDSAAERFEMYTALRQMILDAASNGSHGPSDGIVGVAIDIPSDDDTATLVAMSDDTTSLYTSTGGGTIGAGEHQPAAMASRTLLTTVHEHLERFEPGDDQDFPPPGHVRVHVIARPSSGHVDIAEKAFWGEIDHELMPVIAAAQDVMSAIRNISDA